MVGRHLVLKAGWNAAREEPRYCGVGSTYNRGLSFFDGSFADRNVDQLKGGKDKHPRM